MNNWKFSFGVGLTVVAFYLGVTDPSSLVSATAVVVAYIGGIIVGDA